MSSSDLAGAADLRKIVNRLKRAEGQLAAVIAAIESGAECREVVTQLAATSSAIDRAGYLVICAAMKNCLEGKDASISVDELEKLFLTLA